METTTGGYLYGKKIHEGSGAEEATEKKKCPAWQCPGTPKGLTDAKVGKAFSVRICDSFLQAICSLGSEEMYSLFDGCYHFAVKSGRVAIRHAVKPSIFNGFSGEWINSAYSHSLQACCF